MKKQKKTSHTAMPKNYSDCKGNFHILSDEWGVVLKNSVVL